ncbi:(Ni/Fe) hydrogenase, b-type cytochrome subunit [Thermincola ferriacetica]|uniref:(Ni/Fe) hydrogenase, b-type cytochrome subunit n=1 Tax=Thermincola ferriacetica TaxID=281456 RepID=A0A0L6W1J2_9FIRM|nr:cytochrome b/b6 domain-containing protein [Thermincola ferriacetica]KNZ69432.1 (Ni/Fe) hydrogenase, b-type cytochrome subunit [Thermincola ferriacetica]
MPGQKVLIQPRGIRILHWLLAFGLVALLLSGLYIHSPFITAPYVTLRTAQIIQLGAGFITAGIVALRLYYALVTGDYKNIMFKPADFKEFIKLIKYYLFLAQKEPPHKKYNAGQKLIFTSWLIAFLFQFCTGLLLYYPVWVNNHPFFGHLQTIRFYHYLVALWFLATLPIHVYLVLTGDPGRLQAIFTGWARLARPKGS